MASRLALQALLVQILESDNVYFQEPESSKMVYPCITYRLDNAETEFAGNLPYSYKKRYLITVIDGDPDSAIPEKVALLPTCIFDRFYPADGLNHYVYKLFF